MTSGAYNLAFNTPYNRRIAADLISKEMDRNQVGEPEKFNYSVGMRPVGGNATVAPASARIQEMDAVNPMHRPGRMVDPNAEKAKIVRSGVTTATNSPYYNQVELRVANSMSTMQRKPFTHLSRARREELTADSKEKEEDSSTGDKKDVPERKKKGGRVPMVRMYYLPAKEVMVGEGIASILGKIGKFARKAIPKVAKSVLKFAKGAEGQKVIGNVLSEVGTQAVRKIFESPNPLAEQEGSGMSVEVARSDMPDELHKTVYDMVVNKEGKIKKKWADVIKGAYKKSDKKEKMTGGFIPAIIGAIAAAITAASTAAGVGTEISASERARIKEENLNKTREKREGLKQIATRYMTEKGDSLDKSKDKVWRRLQDADAKLALDEKKYGGQRLGQFESPYDAIIYALEHGAPIETGGKMTKGDKRGLVKKAPMQIPFTEKEFKGLLDVEMNKEKKGRGVRKQAGVGVYKGGMAVEPGKKYKAECEFKEKRPASSKVKERGQLIKQVMKDRGVSLAQASKIIKDEGLMSKAPAADKPAAKSSKGRPKARKV